MNMRRLTLVVTVCMLIAVFTSCGCQHEWIDATCTTPKTCSLCGEIQGEAAGHNWLDATCTAPKSCKNCDATEGKMLGHDWQEATTEAPTTCSRCKVTEGTKLMTDPRFTTASTKEFYGKWTCATTFSGEQLEMEGYIDELPVIYNVEFTNIGDMKIRIEFEDIHEVTRMVTEYSRDVVLSDFYALGLSEEQVDEIMISTYGCTAEEYIEKIVDDMDLDVLLDAAAMDYVYYVGQNGLYISDSWYGEFEVNEYILDGDTLTLKDLDMDDSDETLTLEFTKVK